MDSSDYIKRIEGYGLTTANILYRLPDHPVILQEYVWQAYDVAPRFPELNRFLEFWKTSLDGALHSVRVAHRDLLAPGELKAVRQEFQLH